MNVSVSVKKQNKTNFKKITSTENLPYLHTKYLVLKKITAKKRKPVELLTLQN